MKKYINKISLILSTILIVSTSTSCIKDGLEPCLDGSELTGPVAYMPVYLTTGSGLTRAGVGEEFDAGTIPEISLSDEAYQYAVFYNSTQELPVAVAEISDPSIMTPSGLNRSYTFVLATVAGHSNDLDFLKSLEDCYIFLNSNYNDRALMAMTKSDLTSLTVDSPFFVDSKGNKFLKYVNSVYLKDGVKTIDTNVNTEYIYNTYQEAIEQAWRGNAAVNAYMQRVAAKFSITFENEDYNNPVADRDFPLNDQLVVFSHLTNNGVPYYEDGPDTGGKYSAKVRLTGWGMNALERESYLFQNFNPSGNYFTDWSNPDYKRVFWSEDKNYLRAVYPFQYRKALDKTDIPAYSEKIVGEKDNNILLNKSYNNLNINQFKSQYEYTLENTFDFKDSSFKAILDDRPELLAGTHMIICAELLTNLDNINKWEARDIYRDRNNKFYKNEEEAYAALVCYMVRMLESHASLKFTYYDWMKGGAATKLYAKTPGPCKIYLDNVQLTMDNYKQVIKAHQGRLTSEANFEYSDGQRILWNDNMKILDGDGNPIGIYSYLDDIEPEKNVWLRDATVDDLKSIIYEHIGVIDHFQNGKMYYAVPIGYIQSKSSNPENPDYDIYGVVRNSEYEICVRSVNGLGTPVDNPDQPIIPNTTETQDHLYLGFKILNWHLIEETVPGAL